MSINRGNCSIKGAGCAAISLANADAHSSCCVNDADLDTNCESCKSVLCESCNMCPISEILFSLENKNPMICHLAQMNLLFGGYKLPTRHLSSLEFERPSGGPSVNIMQANTILLALNIRFNSKLILRETFSYKNLIKRAVGSPQFTKYALSIFGDGKFAKDMRILYALNQINNCGIIMTLESTVVNIERAKKLAQWTSGIADVVPLKKQHQFCFKLNSYCAIKGANLWQAAEQATAEFENIIMRKFDDEFERYLFISNQMHKFEPVEYQHNNHHPYNWRIIKYLADNFTSGDLKVRTRKCLIRFLRNGNDKFDDSTQWKDVCADMFIAKINASASSNLTENLKNLIEYDTPHEICRICRALGFVRLKFTICSNEDPEFLKKLYSCQDLISLYFNFRAGINTRINIEKRNLSRLLLNSFPVNYHQNVILVALRNIENNIYLQDQGLLILISSISYYADVCKFIESLKITHQKLFVDNAIFLEHLQYLQRLNSKFIKDSDVRCMNRALLKLPIENRKVIISKLHDLYIRKFDAEIYNDIVLREGSLILGAK